MASIPASQMHDQAWLWCEHVLPSCWSEHFLNSTRGAVPFSLIVFWWVNTGRVDSGHRANSLSIQKYRIFSKHVMSFFLHRLAGYRLILSSFKVIKQISHPQDEQNWPTWWFKIQALPANRKEERSREWRRGWQKSGQNMYQRFWYYAKVECQFGCQSWPLSPFHLLWLSSAARLHTWIQRGRREGRRGKRGNFSR